MASTPIPSPTRLIQGWYRPTISPEHGVYMVLLISFVVGAAAAQHWTWATSLALLCALCGFQAEHPLMLQVKQRSSWKLRFLVWGGVYGGLAVLSAGWLYWQQGLGWSPLLGVYGAALVALGVDVIAVYHRGQKSIVNELITFAAVCLAAPLGYIATTGTLTPMVWGLWILCCLYFSGTIFTLKLRKPPKGEAASAPLRRAGVYHALATLLLASLYGLGLLPLIPALAFGVALGKFLGIYLGLDWFRTTRIGPVAMIETMTALLFGVIVTVALLSPVIGAG